MKLMFKRAVNLGLFLVLILFGTFLFGFEGFMAREDVAFASPAFPTNRPLIYVDPPLTNLTVGSEFTISVKIFNLTNNKVTALDEFGRPQDYPLGNMYGFEFRFSWDPSILEYKPGTKRVFIPVQTYPTGVLNTPTLSVADTITSINGTYDIAYASAAPAEPFNNPGLSNTIFNVTFRVKREGASALMLGGIPPSLKVKLPAAPGQPYPLILHEKREALFITPGAPAAEFTTTPSDGYAAENKSVVFDASASYDPDSSPSITLYMWNFGDLVKQNATGPVISHSYSAAGGYTVKLRVLDNENAISATKERQLTVVELRDVKVRDIIMNATTVLWGDPLGINVTVANVGGAPEIFAISTYYNSTPVSPTGTMWTLIDSGSFSVNATSERIRPFTLDTGTLPPQNVTLYIFANMTAVPHEYNVTNNSWDFIKYPRVAEVSTVVTHDIALSSLETYVTSGTERFSSPFIKGENVTIKFRARANRTADELADITLRVIASNGTVLLTQQWIDKALPRQTSEDLYYSAVSLESGNLNVTVSGTVEDDVEVSNNFMQTLIKVVIAPTLQIADLPQTISDGDTVTLDARASQGSISQFTWTFKLPGFESFGDPKTGAAVNHTFNKVGIWTIRLVVTDTDQLTHTTAREPATTPYRKEIQVRVQAKPGIPLEYLIIGAVAGIGVVAGLAFYMRSRKGKQQLELPE